MGRRGGDQTITSDPIVNATGFRPDLVMLREIRLALDDVVEAPAARAAHRPERALLRHGRTARVRRAQHPEQDFFIAGMKSYGRAPTFLLATGYEQVRSITA